MTDSPLAARKDARAPSARAAFADGGRPARGAATTVEEQLGALRREARRLGHAGRALQGHALRHHRAGRGGATRARAPPASSSTIGGDLERGDETAETALRFLVEKHADSKQLPAHILRLGDFYADLARDYVAAHERPLAFDEDAFLLADRPCARHVPQGRHLGRRHARSPRRRHASPRIEAWKRATLARYR